MCIAEARSGGHRPRAEHGVSLVELIIFIVVVSIGVAGVVGALSMATRASADPLIQKQALAIAEGLLEEVQLQPFTYCDPDDPNAASALSAADCTGGVGGVNDENRLPLGPETGEARTSATTPYDNVSDYNTYQMPAGITDPTGAAIPLLGGYSARVDIVNQALAPVLASDSLRITVTVNGPGPPGSNTKVVLDGYRMRYAPNALP